MAIDPIWGTAGPSEWQTYNSTLEGMQNPDIEGRGGTGGGVWSGSGKYVYINGQPYIRLGTNDPAAIASFDPYGGGVFFDPTYGMVVPASVARARTAASDDFIDKYGVALAGAGLAAVTAPAVAAGAAEGVGAAGSTLPDSYWSMVADAGTGAATDAGAGIGLGAADTGLGGAYALEGGAMDMAGTGTALQGGATAASIPPGTGSLLQRLTGLNKDDMGTLAAGATAVGGLAALAGAAGGQSVTTSTAPLSAEERELIALNAELTKRQLSAVDAMQPWQRRLLEMSMADLERQEAQNRAFDAAVTPEQQAAFMKSEFERAQRMGPIQDEMLQIQLDAMRRGGAATPQQEALIKSATDAAIAAGHGDIDASTSRGIGLIADELANARGLRLSDSPISGEAALLAREGEIQKGSLTRNLRASEAQSRLNFPLAVQQLQSQIGMGQQQLATNAAQFQADLRQRAYQNRLALTGQSASSGIGLASIGGGNALGALTSSRLANTTTSKSGIGLGEIGTGLSGLSAAGDWIKRF